MANGRLEIPDSMFFRNANDLSLQLIIAVTQLLFLLYQRQIWARAMGMLGMAGALICMLETAARGAFIAILLFIAVGLALARRRTKLILAGLPAVVALLVWLAPSGVFHRLTLYEPEDVTRFSQRLGASRAGIATAAARAA